MSDGSTPAAAPFFTIQPAYRITTTGMKPFENGLLLD
jgi:hypothetical protein